MPRLACPTCRREVERHENRAFPFCSERCRLIDLGRWLGEEFGIPIDEAVDGGPTSGAGEGH